MTESDQESAQQRVARLREAFETATREESRAREDVAEAGNACDAAEAIVQSTEGVTEESEASRCAALAEVSSARAKVDEATAAADGLRARLRRLGGGDAEVDVSDVASPEVDESALRTLTDRELNEVRKLPNPPPLVRRALELVQAMLNGVEGTPPPAVNGAPARPAKVVSSGADGSAAPSGGSSGGVGVGEVPWAELQKMLARDDFIKRVLALRPLPLSLQPKLLEHLESRWPSLREANAQPPKDAASSWKAAVQKARGARDGGVLTARTKTNDAPQPSSRSNRLRAAVAAAAESSKSDPHGKSGGNATGTPPPVTVEAVEYASRPCGAIFRFCAHCAGAAVALAAERDRLLAEADEASKRLLGLHQALDAAIAYDETLRNSNEQVAAARRRAEAQLAAACDRRLDAKVTHTASVRTYDEAKRLYELALSQLEAQAEAEARNREDAERRGRERAAAEAAQRLAVQAEIERDLATRHKPDPELVWVREHSLAPECLTPVEFGQAGSSTLPNEVAPWLQRVMKELERSTHLKLHIAGHTEQGEEARVASLRAQAVGGALIAMGASALRLRAKGYAATVALPRTSKLKLRLKSARRVTLHALSEVCTKYGIEFGRASATVGEKPAKLLTELAKLLLTEPTMRLSVEAHTDATGEAADNVVLSNARAAAVVAHLEGLGVEAARLTPHGFGQAFPCDDNGTEAGRQRNRRVEFVVIPDVATLKPK